MARPTPPAEILLITARSGEGDISSGRTGGAERANTGASLSSQRAFRDDPVGRVIISAVDDSHYSLVLAAAQAAGPCVPGEEAAWGRRVHGLTVDLHLIAQQAKQDIDRLESSRTFIAFLEKVEIEESSRRGLLTLRLPSGESETIRTEQKDTDRGQALIDRAQSLEGRWVLVYRYNERKTGQRNQSVRMLAHLLDLGMDGAVPSTTAKKMVLQEAGGDVARAQQAWAEAGLPGSGPISVDQLEQARTVARSAG
jgi:hypothetical protein